MEGQRTVPPLPSTPAVAERSTDQLASLVPEERYRALLGSARARQIRESLAQGGALTLGELSGLGKARKRGGTTRAARREALELLGAGQLTRRTMAALEQ